MAQEVRSILFTAEEIHSAVTHLLLQRIQGLQPHQIERVDIELRQGVLLATVRFCRAMNVKRVLDTNELMSAVLMHCRRARIPLPSRSHKRLGVVAGCLSLTTVLNLDAIAPWVHDETVVHAAVDPNLQAQHGR